jgi:hypothetical protein
MPEDESPPEEPEEPETAEIPEHPLDKALKKRLFEIQEEFFRNDSLFGTMSETAEFSTFVFSIADTANTAKAIKAVCEAFSITMDDFFAAYGFGEEDDDEEEEGEEEEGEGGEEEEEAEEPPLPPPKKKSRPVLDSEFLQP